MKLKTYNGEIGAMLKIADPPQSFALELLKLFSFPNPQYQAAVRFSKWGRVSARIPETIDLAWMEDNCVVLPRGLEKGELSNRGQMFLRQVRWQDNRQTAPVTYPGLKIALNPQQRNLLNHFMELIKQKKECRFGNILYIAPTSTGKTLLLANAAKESGQRSLILVTTELIKKSWFDDLYKGFGLAPRDIGLIQQKTFRIGKYFTIASVMTLIKRQKQWPELFSKIGTLIVDEADLASAPSIHKFILSCPAKYIIGATATFNAQNSKERIWLPSLFGAPRKRLLMDQKDTQSSMALRKVEVIKSDFEYELLDDDGNETQLDYHDLTDAIMDDDDRNRLIVDCAKKYWKKGESVLIASRRVPHVHILNEMCLEAGMPDSRTLTGETNVDRIYTEKLIEAIIKRRCRCLNATMQAIKRGANLPPLSVLILATPLNKRDLEQLIGRIRRRDAKKKTVILVYILDHKVPYLGRIFYSRATPLFRKMKIPEFLNKYYA